MSSLRNLCRVLVSRVHFVNYRMHEAMQSNLVIAMLEYNEQFFTFEENYLNFLARVRVSLLKFQARASEIEIF